MKLSSVVATEIYGGLLLLVMTGIIISLILNNFIRRRMVLACKKTLQNKEKVLKVSVNDETAAYLNRHRNEDLYRIDELITKRHDIIKYKLCLKKRSFDFYLKKQKLLNYKVIAIKIY